MPSSISMQFHEEIDRHADWPLLAVLLWIIGRSAALGSVADPHLDGPPVPIRRHRWHLFGPQQDGLLCPQAKADWDSVRWKRSS